jgi:O-succinylbenzoate synthase
VNKIEQGYTYLKWKIGVEPTAKEQVEAVSLLDSLPKAVALRLDANASLSIEDLDSWLQLLADYREQVDYLEQPLAVGEEVAMASRMMDTGIAIALDESLNGQDGARWLEAGEWAGPLVIKAPLIGNVETLRQKLDPVAEQVVLSSVFETGVGLLNTLSLADALGATLQPIGFDTLDAFDDKLMPLESAPFIGAPERSTYTAEQIWNLI